MLDFFPAGWYNGYFAPWQPATERPGFAKNTNKKGAVAPFCSLLYFLPTVVKHSVLYLVGAVLDYVFQNLPFHFYVCESRVLLFKTCVLREVGIARFGIGEIIALVGDEIFHRGVLAVVVRVKNGFARKVVNTEQGLFVYGVHYLCVAVVEKLICGVYCLVVKGDIVSGNNLYSVGAEVGDKLRDYLFPRLNLNASVCLYLVVQSFLGLIKIACVKHKRVDFVEFLNEITLCRKGFKVLCLGLVGEVVNNGRAKSAYGFGVNKGDVVLCPHLEYLSFLTIPILYRCGRHLSRGFGKKVLIFFQPVFCVIFRQSAKKSKCLAWRPGTRGSNAKSPRRGFSRLWGLLGKCEVSLALYYGLDHLAVLNQLSEESGDFLIGELTEGCVSVLDVADGHRFSGHRSHKHHLEVFVFPLGLGRLRGLVAVLLVQQFHFVVNEGHQLLVLACYSKLAQFCKILSLGHNVFPFRGLT